MAESSTGPIEGPRPCIFFLHGITEHCRLYDHVAAFFGSKGYDMFAFDYQGHGRSEGTRLYIDKFDDLINDARDMYDFVDSWEPFLAEKSDTDFDADPQMGTEYTKDTKDTKDTRNTRAAIPSEIVIMGHSLGGLIALLMDKPGKKVLSAPALGSSGTWYKYLNLLNCIPVPKHMGIVNLRPEQLTDDARLQELMTDDPLQINRTLPWNTIREIINASMQVSATGLLSSSIYIFHGMEDKVINIANSQYFFQSCQNNNVRASLVQIPNKPHDFLMNKFEIGEKSETLSPMPLDEILELMYEQISKPSNYMRSFY
jgi:alpha-beta hydrolase superfamily lysophospholipase